MENTSLTKQRILSELSKSPHGKLAEYIPIGKQAIAQEPEFAAHLMAWDRTHGQIRDSKVALPVVTLAFSKEPEFLDNAFAHLALLGPRELLRAYEFAREIRPAGQMLPFRRMIADYLAEKEQDKGWDHLAIQHRKTLKTLYALSHAKPEKDRTHAFLFGFKGKGTDKVLLPLPKGSVFEAVANLKNMSAQEAAGAILKYRVPFLIATGALGVKAKDTDLVMSLISRMSPTELVTNTKMLEKLGVKTNPALRGAFEAALAKASTSKKNTLKTTAAIEAIEDEGLKNKLRGLQDKQIAATGGVEGNWLVLGDKSPSMEKCLDVAKMVAATLTRFVKGHVNLVFFDSSPRHFDVTGMSYDQILKETRHVLIGGGTSIGCGVQYAIEKKFEVDGIAVISDAAENSAPLFVDQYRRLSLELGKQPPVYLYRFETTMRALRDMDLAVSMRNAGLEMQEFDLRGQSVDMYSLPNLIQTMRTQRFGLIDEVFATPLLSLKDVLKTSKELVHA